MIMLFSQLGASALVALVVLVLCIPLQSIIVKRIGAMTKAMVKKQPLNSPQCFENQKLTTGVCYAIT